MRPQTLARENGQSTTALIFDQGDSVLAALRDYARQNAIAAASFTAIGAFSDCTLAWFDWDRKEYKKIPIHDQVEVLMLSGDIALEESGEPKIHAHVVVGKADGTAHGGHLMEATVRPTLELILIQDPALLHRLHDPHTGLSLIHPA